MAIGLGRMFGFTFPKNFDYPFISCSASELWRRWHISLSTWFKDYVYIPLGGSRKGNAYLHLLCVFLLTGLWHGASWNYVMWGAFWGVLIVMQRWITRKVKIPFSVPKMISWAFTMFLWLLSLVVFRTESLYECVQYFRSMFGVLPLQDVGFSLPYYIHKYEIFIIVSGMTAMMPLGKLVYLWLQKKMPEAAFTVLENTGALVLFGISALYVVTGTYNPFIYFQF